MGERIRNWTLAGVVTLLACLVVGTTAVFLGVDLSADVHRVFSAGSSLGTTAQGVNFFIERGIEDSAAYDFYVGVRAAAVGLLTIGIPLGVAAKLAQTANRWLVLDQQWGTVFQMGFLLQLASTGLAAGGLLLMSFDGVVGYMAAPLVSLILVGDVVIGAVALRSWRRMQEGRHNVSLVPLTHQLIRAQRAATAFTATGRRRARRGCDLVRMKHGAHRRYAFVIPYVVRILSNRSAPDSDT